MLGYYSAMFATLWISWSMASVCSHFVKPMPTHKFSYVKAYEKLWEPIFMSWRVQPNPSFRSPSAGFCTLENLYTRIDFWRGSIDFFRSGYQPSCVNAFLREPICRIIKVVKYYLEITYKKRYIRGQKIIIRPLIEYRITQYMDEQVWVKELSQLELRWIL